MQYVSRPTTTGLYCLARTTTIPCWAIKTRPRLTHLSLLADMSGHLGQLQHSHRMSFSSLPGRSRVSTFVVVPVEDNHVPRQGVRAKLTVGMGVSGGGGIGARGTVLLEKAVLHRRTDVLWTRLESVLVHQRRAPRVMTLRREVAGDCQRLIVARTKKTVTPTVACVTTIFSRYVRFADADQSTLAFPMLGGGRAEPWQLDGLRHVFIHACAVGSGGMMTQRELKALCNYTLKVEAATDAATTRPFTDAFKTVWRFIAAVRRCKRTLIAPLNWRKVIRKSDGRQYTVFFRDALQAAHDEVMRAQPEDLYWGASSSTKHDAGSIDASIDASTTAPDTVLRNARDGEMYKRQKEHVDGTLHPGTPVLGFYMYSDPTVLSSSGAVSAHPLRMRVIDINTDEVRWVTLAYIPQVEAKFLETMKGQEVRAELLQRIQHVVFRISLLASHDGTWLNLPGGGCVRVSPLALRYECDQPEERAGMCLKGSGCLFPCTACTIGRDSSCTEAGTNAPPRDVHETVRAQLRNVLMGDSHGAGAMRTEAETAHSLNSMVPALAA